MPKRHTTTRFAAKLLFQFRVGSRRSSNRMRTCEERIINFAAHNAESALLAARRYGKAAEISYVNDSGETVQFEFVGVLDLIQLEPECAPDEVWYDIRQMLTPMERRQSIVPPKHELAAFRSEAAQRRLRS